MDQLSGQDVVPADFSKTLQVVCCGFSRTATVSMSIAMQILLKGPVGHGGSTSLRREPGMHFLRAELGNVTPLSPHTFPRADSTWNSSIYQEMDLDHGSWSHWGQKHDQGYTSFSDGRLPCHRWLSGDLVLRWIGRIVPWCNIYLHDSRPRMLV